MNKIDKKYLIAMFVLFLLAIVVTTLVLTKVLNIKFLSISFTFVAGIQFVLGMYHKIHKMNFILNFVIAGILVLSGLCFILL